MKRLQAYKFQLKTKAAQKSLMRRFAGGCRFVWNKALALEKEAYEETGRRLGYSNLCVHLRDWKQEEETSFLKEINAQILQQTLMDLDRAYRNFFSRRATFPKFKKKGVHDSFRFPQGGRLEDSSRTRGFKLDEPNSRIYLPKIGWVSYRNSRKMEGKPKQATVSYSAGKWYVSIQTEREVDDPIHPSVTAIGVDMGVVNFATLSDSTCIKPLNSFRRYEKKLVKLQRKLAKRTRFSANWQKRKARVQHLHRKIANVRHDFLHKTSTTISKNHAVVIVEDLHVRNMTRAAAGTIEAPGHNVWATARRNLSILDQGWFEFRRQLDYKLKRLGGRLIAVPPQHTSQRCSRCGHTDARSRRTQADFRCTACGFESNADHNAALNILAAGQAVAACGSGRAQAPALNQEPTCGAA